MEIIEAQESEISEIKIIGDLDANSSIKLDSFFKKQFQLEKYNFYIDCMELRYISSAGLGVFISHLEYLNQHKGKFVFYNMNAFVFDTFKILGLDQVMEIADTKEEAKMLMDESKC